MSRFKYDLIPLFIALLFLFIHVQSSYAANLPLRLVWERNTESDLAFYTVYYGTASRQYSNIIDVDTRYPYCIFDEDQFTGGQTYYIALTATDFSLNESGYSNELVVYIDPSSNTTTTSPTNSTTTTASTTHTSTTTTGPTLVTTTTITPLLFIEAEDGAINPPMERAEDEAASSEYYVWSPLGSGNIYSSDQATGYAEYVFEVPVSGDFVVWGRVISNGDYEDSFFVSVDEGEYAIWDTPWGGTETWVWDLVNDRGIADPVISHLEAGTHTLIIKQREDGTKIDKILITNDMKYVPEGKGVVYTSTTTTPLPTNQKEYCSTDEVLILHDTIPEEGTMSVTIPDDLTNAISAILSLTMLDPDIAGEGYIYINGNDPLELPTDRAYDYQEGVDEQIIEITIDPGWITQGENIFRFTHVATWGYEVRALCVRVGYQDTTTTTSLSPPVPTTTIIPSTTTTSIEPDDTPPTGTVVINNGADIANSQIVTLQLSAEDDESGMGEGAQMSFSNDNIQWITKPFASTKYWVLSAGEGEKTVYVKFCDAEGNWMSQPVSDSIMMETSKACLKPVQLDATAVESSGDFLRFWSKEKVVDGKTTTGWLSPLRLSPREEYIILDLGENRIVNRVDILSHPFLLLDLFPLDFQIMLSSDSENWTEISSESDYASPSSHTDSWAFEETKTRYIKLAITKAKPFLFFFYLTYISEIEVHGCDETDTPGFQFTSMVPVDQTKTRVVKLTPDRKIPDEKKPPLVEEPPGRPGKPVFILNKH